MKVNYAKKKRRRWCGCAVPFFVRQVPRRCRRGSWRISRNLENTKKKNRCSNVCRRICFNRRQHWEKEDVQDAGRTHQITDYADDNGASLIRGITCSVVERLITIPIPMPGPCSSLSLALSLSSLVILPLLTTWMDYWFLDVLLNSLQMCLQASFLLFLA
jgi:hypothetical protein